IADCDRFVSFQLTTYVPTGLAMNGLGNNHVSLEPALLLYQELSDRLTLQGELRDWIPISGTDFQGNIIRYGAGLTYLALDNPSFRVYPVAEFVGWTVLSGKESTLGTPVNASGDTIVNAKMGVRFGFGEPRGPGIF